ncbi:hypothetical protein TCAL_03324 [Tigriopus californicus]|uniref:Lipid droplet-associated hydrolase n=1 Tax=Tigriopus californicus TaxID=6832 RepID=A0A553P7G4_TIGCA|nr:lipid droplet-associated hydrolase-like [Tigriopus californicus]TRY73626.1 hypothetical protein TCAL_03324 [Tigriopus californicus]|eukprot:TCALIF_03324-PA protein Name:"Similar to RCJMB04_2g19 UPF0554 protein C2orf43 homolog (Gallus gallus)" AED:0.08 eAED:0.08 QI:100/1/1/1/1/1/4/40/317
MQRQFVQVSGGLTTRVLTLGTPITEAHHSASALKRLILVIPGNPGLSSYYEDFMRTLYHGLDESVPVWAVGHFGHDLPPATPSPSAASELPNLSGHEAWYNLEGQIQHKIRFIEEFIPANCHLTLVGHSIGCKMILEAMDRLATDRPHLRSYFLFPTIERMYQSPDGLRTWIMCAYLRWLVIVLTYCLRHMVPRAVLRRLIRFHMGDLASDVCVDTTLDLIHPRVTRHATYLAYTELLTVNELEVEKLRGVLPRIRFYFGTIDRWCPMEYCHQLKARLPQADVVICERKIEHAFVIHSSHEMGKILTQWYKDDHNMK